MWRTRGRAYARDPIFPNHHKNQNLVYMTAQRKFIIKAKIHNFNMKSRKEGRSTTYSSMQRAHVCQFSILHNITCMDSSLVRQDSDNVLKFKTTKQLKKKKIIFFLKFNLNIFRYINWIIVIHGDRRRRTLYIVIFWIIKYSLDSYLKADHRAYKLEFVKWWLNWLRCQHNLTLNFWIVKSVSAFFQLLLFLVFCCWWKNSYPNNKNNIL